MSDTARSEQSSPAPARHELARGIWGLLASPFTEDGAFDDESLVRLVTSYSRLDLAGMTVLGVFGEAADLTPAERRRAVELVHDTAPSTALVVGVTSLDTAAAIEEIGNVADVGGQAIDSYLVQLNDTDPDMVVEHFRRIHEATGARIVAQDYPAISGVRMTQEQILDVAVRSPAVSGIKLESVPTPTKVAFLAARTTVPVFGGLGGSYLIDELAAGAAGAMTGFTAPEGLIACWQAYLDGGFEAAATAFAPYLPLVNFEFQPGLARLLRKEGFKARGLFTTSVSRTPVPDPPPGVADLAIRHMTRLPAAPSA
ncbi:dihydrodipicolinate synthase family protein [Prauserella cavernicola]|uniref:Dihydrodipicolinate synthase family protein n=1 Tax=Prauserella cavernicola TaxID=2800127 RepID=A0A934QP91_9PSEU|nr:dihydrodipicolinate synthase family protein [Prauserella cavernicola]MBK1783870.1 dihydrodipicolinate synthase family protein [Prauserella cavernicola]